MNPHFCISCDNEANDRGVCGHYFCTECLENGKSMPCAECEAFEKLVDRVQERNKPILKWLEDE